MKLSEAILLGDSLKKCEPGTWLKTDGSCGCALGGALLACGMSGVQFNREFFFAPNYDVCEMATVKRLWPWLNRTILGEISGMYHCVAAGGLTIEQLADYVRSIEPEEHDGTTLTKLELAVRYAEMNAGIERSSDAETSDEMDAAVSQGFRP